MGKNNYMQKIRGICIILVILIHSLYLSSNSIVYYNIVTRRLINFATAVFVFIAGYFTKIDNVKDFYKKKIKRIILPLLIWNIIYYIFANIGNNNIFNVKNMIKKVLLGASAPHLYYLYVLIQLFILAPLIFNFLENNKSNIKKICPLVITPLYCILLLIYIIIFKKQFPFYNYWIFGWFSYYYLGMLLKQHSPILSKNKIKILMFSMIMLSIIEGILYYLYIKDYNYAVSQLTLFNSLYSLLVCCFIYCNKEKNTQNQLIVQIGNYSFGIYLCHILVLKSIKRIVTPILKNYFITVALLFVATSFISYIIVKIYYKKIKPM